MTTLPDRAAPLGPVGMHAPQRWSPAGVRGPRATPTLCPGRAGPPTQITTTSARRRTGHLAGPLLERQCHGSTPDCARVRRACRPRCRPGPALCPQAARGHMAMTQVTPPNVRTGADPGTVHAGTELAYAGQTYVVPQCGPHRPTVLWQETTLSETTAPVTCGDCEEHSRRRRTTGG